MNIFFDSCNEDLIIALFDEEFKLIDFIIKKNLKQKAEILADLFLELLNSNKLKAFNIKNFYLNLGPGSFTGVRIGLVFIRTIVQITNAKIYSTNTFNLLSFDNQEKKEYLIDAKGNTSYQAFAKNGKLHSEIKIINKKTENNFNFQNLLNNFQNLVENNVFKLEKNVLNIKPLYIKKTNIGQQLK
ncbi:tRNA (adenosine(37)-N6)-threonylcarbamoyltransferase complex dimerization subunit type 1 TsaB [[Mycoplasma] collis]|uniref:tRNA (adenosine(37)-N6)-threonylcarbamoyltransferase complex dimerization subunit type 1 TsaB n=1 Tax=[Mycoplasma] collis TaxID=2127 RepID=UPI00051AC6D9|nr:tRNA (adenosine(37)-N6)-threonylcarbamoyltransferase complex dimerization subunit type 1 TsaB [[Mycoplasma] collis]